MLNKDGCGLGRTPYRSPGDCGVCACNRAGAVPLSRASRSWGVNRRVFVAIRPMPRHAANHIFIASGLLSSRKTAGSGLR